MFRFLKNIFVGVLFCLPGLPSAQEMEGFIREIYLDTESKQLAQRKAVNEISRELVIEIIGKDKYEGEKSKIEDNIIKNQNRYILSLKTSKAVLQDDGKFAFTVKIKVSRGNLKKLLLEQNLFYASEGSSCLLPMVSFSSHFKEGKKSYSWWLGHSNEEQNVTLQQLAGSFFELLSAEFIKIGFYALNPVFQKMKEGTPPSVLPKKNRYVRDFTSLSKFYACDVVLLGYVHLGQLPFARSSPLFNIFSAFKDKHTNSPPRPYFTQFSFNVVNIKSRQFLFKLRKKFPFPDNKQMSVQDEALLRSKDVLDSITFQLSSYREKGSLDLNRLTISVQGPLSYAQKEQLKKSLVRHISSLQNLEERLLTSSRVVYEAESSKNIRFIAQQLKKAVLPHFIIQLKGYKKQELEIYAKKRE